MSQLPPALSRLAAQLAKFPGIGERTALRMAFFMLGAGNDSATSLASALTELHDGVGFCSRCHNLASAEHCSICADPRRNEPLICVVSSIPDLLAIESTSSFSGTYHVLGGVLSPLRGVGPGELQLESLVHRAVTETPDELILAVPVSIEGEATASYIQRKLRDTNVTVSRIASGVPQGAELEYLDAATLGRALLARTEM